MIIFFIKSFRKKIKKNKNMLKCEKQIIKNKLIFIFSPVKPHKS